MTAPAPKTPAPPSPPAARARMSSQAPLPTPQGPEGTQAPAEGTPDTSVPSAGLKAIADTMTEDRGRHSLEARMRKLMKDLGLWGYHPRRSEKSEKGWPDWAIIGTRILYRELKTERGTLTPEQEEVRDRILTAGGDWGLWRPSDLLAGRIAAELRAIAPGPLGTAQARTGGAG